MTCMIYPVLLTPFNTSHSLHSNHTDLLSIPQTWEVGLQGFEFLVSLSGMLSLIFIWLLLTSPATTDHSIQVKVKVLVAQSYLTLFDPMNCSPTGSTVHGIFQARILEWTHALLQRIFSTQGLNPGLPHCRQILCHLSYQGSPIPSHVLAYYLR